MYLSVTQTLVEMTTKPPEATMAVNPYSTPGNARLNIVCDRLC